MASLLYLKGIEQTFLAAVNWETDTIKLAFMSTSFTPNAATQSFWSDVSASQASGTTDVTLAGKDIRIDTVNGRVEFDFNDPSLATVTATTNKFTIRKDTGVAATSPLLGCFDIAEGTLSPVSGTLSVAINAEGLFAITS